MARARIELTLASPDVLVTPERGAKASLRNGLSTSLAGLAWSLQLIVIGLCLIGPWLLLILLIWFAVRLVRWLRRKTTPIIT